MSRCMLTFSMPALMQLTIWCYLCIACHHLALFQCQLWLSLITEQFSISLTVVSFWTFWGAGRSGVLRCMVLFSVWLGTFGVGEEREIESNTQHETLL